MGGADRKGVTDFGAELRAWRSSRGWTQTELGAALGYSGSFVSDLERGDRLPSRDFADRCDREFETPGTFARWCEATRNRAFPAWFAPIIPHEREAVRIHGWALGPVPGLLQTEAYARSLIRARWANESDESIERKVAARMSRQEVLARHRPPMMHLVMHESVFRQVIGSPQVMAAQLDRLIKAAESPGFVLQAFPFSAPDPPGMEGPIFIYDSDEGVPIGYTEFHNGGRIVDSREDVADLWAVMGMLRAVALSPRDSIALLKRIKGELDGLSQVELQRRFRRRVHRGRGGRRRVCARHEAGRV
ncbi:MAG: helix-turn-helix transcriptional regulator [Streptosporangiales bacterium]|jgi:transcriptional regulator with XRE-family HTH domain|nr:helix-turn-helix transcriptional regulator [Streptosporangiales bacterium]